MAEHRLLRGGGRGPAPAEGSGFEVVFDVAELVWEPLG